MKLSIDPEDQAGFDRAKEALLERLDGWLTDQGEPKEEVVDQVGDAGIALDWKWGYADGELAAWEPYHVEELLLDWCPRKLTPGPDGGRDLLAGLTSLLTFLGATGLASGSVPTTRLLMLVDMLTPEFLEEMQDPANFGMAKSLFSAALADGVDPEDMDAIHRWMNEFNQRPEAERRRILPDSSLPLPPSVEGLSPSSWERPTLPPVVLPDDRERAVSAAQAPVLDMFDELVAFVGDGRKLTQAGNLTLADARALVPRLGTGDRVDPTVEGLTYSTRSSTDLTGLQQIFEWAKEAGAVRVERGRVKATAKWTKLAGDPEARFDRALTALMDLGPLESRRPPQTWMAWPEVDQLLEDATAQLLVLPYAVPVPVPVAEIVDVAVDMVLESFEFSSLVTDEVVARRVGNDVAGLLSSLALAGVCVVQHTDDAEHLDTEGGGVSVTLTPVGRAVTHRWLAEDGIEVSEAGRFADLSAEKLLESTDDLDFPVVVGELEAWRARRTDEEAARDMADAARHLEDPGLRNLAFAVLGKIGVGASEAHVRELAGEAATAGWARCWLVDEGLEDQASLFDPDDVASFVDVLAHRLVQGGPDGMLEAMAVVGNHDAQVGAIDGMWRSKSPATSLVLEAIGRAHPTKVVAKAARKATFKHRSWAANQ